MVLFFCDSLKEKYCLQILRENKVYAKLDKCEFWLKEVVFLKHVIFVEGIFIDPRKVEVFLKWERPTNVT